MTDSIDLLSWQSLTATINNIESPNSFWKKLLFGNTDPQATEKVEFGLLTGTRKIAPFVRKNGEALFVDGVGEEFVVVEAPNIRLKRPFQASDLLYNRRPGSVIFADGNTISREAQKVVMRDMSYMADYITNAEEYLCAMAVQGSVSYTTADGANFSIDYLKPAASTVALAGIALWSATTATPSVDFRGAKRQINSLTGLSTTDAVMDSTAADAFLALDVIKKELDYNNFRAGSLTIENQYRDDGVIYLGRYSGVNCWEYSRTADLAGVDTAMVRAGYVEFVAATPAADNVLYYGAIPDMKALKGRKFVGPRFSKSWEEEDPSVLVGLSASRPLPVPRRPGSTYSLKVL